VTATGVQVAYFQLGVSLKSMWYGYLVVPTINFVCHGNARSVAWMPRGKATHTTPCTPVAAVCHQLSLGQGLHAIGGRCG
jgi:hypothetical protein